MLECIYCQSKKNFKINNGPMIVIDKKDTKVKNISQTLKNKKDNLLELRNFIEKKTLNMLEIISPRK